MLIEYGTSYFSYVLCHMLPNPTPPTQPTRLYETEHAKRHSTWAFSLSPAQCPVSCSLNAPSSAWTPPPGSYWPARRPIGEQECFSKAPSSDQLGDRGAVAAVSRSPAAIYMYICPPPCQRTVSGDSLSGTDTTVALLHDCDGQQNVH